MSVIEFKEVEQTFGDRPVLRGLSFKVEKGRPTS